MLTGVVPSSPRFLPSIFIAHTKGSAIPLLVEFSSSVANSRSRAFRKSICAQEKVPTNLGGNYGLATAMICFEAPQPGYAMV